MRPSMLPVLPALILVSSSLASPRPPQWFPSDPAAFSPPGQVPALVPILASPSAAAPPDPPETSPATPPASDPPEASPAAPPASAPPPGPPATASPPTTGSVVVYFGQTKISPDDSLSAYCSSPSIDMVVLTFVYKYSAAGGLPALSMGPYCGAPIAGTELFRCPDVAAAIHECQQNGKRVLLSLGGEAGGADEGRKLDTPEKVDALAGNLWSLFGEGTGLEDKRPFGDAVIDGFDLDNESHDPTGYTALVTALRTRFGMSPSQRRYYLSAAPQCYRPEASLGDAVYAVDFVFLQMYNNPSCGATAGADCVAALKVWAGDIAAKSTVGTTLFAGFLGAQQAGGSGYVEPDQMAALVKEARNLSGFGGVMLWDAVFASANRGADGASYVDRVKAALM